ncbi:hypothetical protein PHYSODRAFT_327721 [Phytophthora sojae]|uniref:FLYWCH-type domain-containing protein n=1 Tax=Phytophthora sojae (strain P6497) TaxID=1094619 RepID=G4Z518_PHYSP|nr:hypothetical protein PHYSODRAFT_327721 [Phytophthora sojae]EGZ19464.1 hypothetical protein PHYSODRAFT_327721 [Phytophthora sojae]|eukprot:XP_009522181.1 hypothetical protein PHYSODRAFT_327721 [Phytophthora sojae]
MLLDPSGSTVPDMLVSQPADGGHLWEEAGGANGAPTGCTNATVGRTRATSKKRDGHTKVYYQGFSYARSNITSVKISYRCSSYRQKCKARFVYMAATVSFDFSELVPHTCRSGAALQSRNAQADGSPCEDVSEAVLEEVDQLAV